MKPKHVLIELLAGNIRFSINNKQHPLETRADG